MLVIVGLLGGSPALVRGADEPAAEKKADDHAADHKHDAAGHKDDHGGHDHDPTDLGHVNATKNLGSPMDFRFDLAVWTFVVFLLLIFVLGKFAWGPIKEGLEKRELGIAAMIDEAQRNQKKAAEQLLAYEKKLAAAADEVREMAAQAKRDAEAMSQKIIADAQATASAKLQKGVEDIESAKNAALAEIAEKSVNTAVKLASNIVRREIRGDDHAALIREAVDKFPSSN